MHTIAREAETFRPPECTCAGLCSAAPASSRKTTIELRSSRPVRGSRQG